MASKLLLIVAFALVLSLVAGQGGYPRGPCRPGSTTRYECNTCRCANDGSGYICTRRVCPPTVRYKRAVPFQVCEPGKAFRQVCNTCVCNSEGTAAICTLKACLPPARQRSVRDTDESDTCTPGEQFNVACNTCTCGSSGSRSDSACTLKAC